MSTSLWIASYQNHVLYASVYVAICSYCWNIDGAASGSFWKIVSYLGTASSILALLGELKYAIKRRNLPPGDSGLPIVGHFITLVTQGGERLALDHLSKYGSMCTFNLLGTPGVILTSDEDVHWMLTQERKGKTQKKTVTKHMTQLIGPESIFMKSGAEHKRLRKAFEPAFTPMAIRSSAATMDEICCTMFAEWEASGEYKVPRDWALLAMRIFMTCTFGEANEERMDKLIVLFEGWIAGFSAKIPYDLPGTAARQAHLNRRQLGEEVSKMVAEFKAQNPPDSEAAKTTVMGRLCYAVDEDGNPPTHEQLVDNLRFFLFAGFDTTKASFGALATYINKYPQMEAALVEEVRTLKDPLDVDQLKNEAPILNAVMAETWRLNAPVVAHSLFTTEEFEYKGYLFPKDTFIWVDIGGHSVSNNSLYPKASEFHFERWLPKDHPLYDPTLANTAQIDYNVMNNKYRPFNMGPHMCLGGHFAKQETRIVLVRLLQKYCIQTRNEQTKRLPLKQLLTDFKLTKRE